MGKGEGEGWRRGRSENECTKTDTNMRAKEANEGREEEDRVKVYKRAGWCEGRKEECSEWGREWREINRWGAGGGAWLREGKMERNTWEIEGQSGRASAKSLEGTNGT